MVKRGLACVVLLGIVSAGCDSGSTDDPFVEPPPGLQEVPISAIVTGGIVLKTNPDGNAPLTATLSFSTTEMSEVRLQVLGPEPLAFEPATLGTSHDLPVLGLYPGLENELEVRVTIPDSVYAADTIRVETPALPEFFPSVEIRSVNESLMEPGWTASALMIGDGGTFRPYPIMFDRDGAIRWYLDLSFMEASTLTAERNANGNMLIGDGRDLYEYDMLGTQVNHWNIPGYWIHHAIIEKPD
ncbi:MAG: aryl-sulfate sulfotransferase, partial [Rhodothermales bacterium]|nr:aryl-sulfate sulfotransferase [Rhodothermales bacterium]